MISVNATLFVQVIHFLLIVFIMNRLMLRPIMRQIDERAKHIEQAKKDAEDMAIEAERLVEKRLSIEKEARKRAGEERASLKQEAASAAETIFEETREEVSGIRARIDSEIEAQVKGATAVLDQEVTALADEIVEKISGRRLSH
jgi:F-type H+-transporting ATPase subunit b